MIKIRISINRNVMTGCLRKCCVSEDVFRAGADSVVWAVFASGFNLGRESVEVFPGVCMVGKDGSVLGSEPVS